MTHLSLKKVLSSVGTLFATSLCLLGSAHAEVIPLESWVHDPIISSVNLTPNGNKMVAVTLADPGAAPDVTVWNTNDLSKPPKRFRPKSIRVFAANWLNDDILLVVGRQTFDIRTGGGGTRWFRDRAFVIDVNKVSADGKKAPFKSILENKEGGISLTDRLPLDKENVLVTVTNREFAEDIYKVNLKNGLAKRVYRGATGESAITDYAGEIRGKLTLEGDNDTTRIEFNYKNPETGKWEQHHALYAAAREGMQPVGFGTDGRTVYMTDNTGRDKNVIRKYDLITRQMSDEIFGGDSFEALNIIQSTDAENFGELIGFIGAGAEIFREYVDPKWKDLQARIDSVLPKGQRHTVTSRSDDYSVMVINSTGPKEAGAYYLLVNGSQLVALGRSMPNLKPEEMADMQFVTYTARDGRDVPGYLTLPKTGKAPYPTIVNPHGGPWARDYLGWDPFVQFLANQGYAVLQPQYRGSQGWGQDLWRAGDRRWGFEMQDDKDDGARWLIEEGIADPDRIAMFGYSYGGYAAMAAIVRQDTPYQCAIAGAGLSELRYFDKVTFENPFGREFQNPTIAGLSPLDHAEEARIPIFIFHGDRDQRVPIEQSRKYVSALKKAEKDVEYLEIPDLWHSFPWWPQHRRLIFSSMTDYLSNRCGPGGI